MSRFMRNASPFTSAYQSDLAQQNHWSERGRATSVANADALGRPRRSVLSFGNNARLICHSYQQSTVR
jgi:hypothetical protein